MSIEHIGLPGGELEAITKTANVLLSFNKTPSLTAGERKTYGTDGKFVSLLLYEYWRPNEVEGVTQLENMKVGVQCLRLLGSGALKECLMFKLTKSTVSVAGDATLVGGNPSTTTYRIRNTEGLYTPYAGLVLEADSFDEDSATPMNVHDCDTLSDVIGNIQAIEEYPQLEIAAVRKLNQ